MSPHFLTLIYLFSLMSGRSLHYYWTLTILAISWPNLPASLLHDLSPNALSVFSHLTFGGLLLILQVKLLSLLLTLCQPCNPK